MDLQKVGGNQPPQGIPVVEYSLMEPHGETNQQIAAGTKQSVQDVLRQYRANPLTAHNTVRVVGADGAEVAEDEFLA